MSSVLLRLFRALSHAPLWLLHALGLFMGWLAYALSPSYRRRLVEHSGQAGLSRWQRWQAVGQTGQMVAEVPRLWGRPHAQALGNTVQWRHVEQLDQAMAEGKGLMVLTGHLGCFEMVAQAYAERHGAQHPITALYRPSKQAWLAEWMVHARNRPGMVASPATLAGVRQMLRALKNGHTVGILPDQVPPEGMGEWAPFFGRPAYTMTMAGKLMAQTGCAAVVLTGERLSLLQRLRQGCEYVVHVRRVPPDVEALLRQGDAAASAAAINRLMQAQIMQFPGQYLWGYNRYKGPRAEILTSATGASAGQGS